ncbi:PQQ-binding-like beta-propeller repeat protein [Chloroflexota bacterium]
MTDAPWPSMRANRCNTAATELHGPDAPNLKWRYDIDSWFHSPPIIDAEGTLYLGSSAGLYALNDDGELKWYVETGENHSVSPPVLAPAGSLICTVCNEGLLFVTADGDRKDVATPNKMCGSSSPTIDDDGNIYAFVDHAAPNGQIFSGMFCFDPEGNLKYRANGGSCHHPALTSDGYLLVKSETRFSFGGDPTECHDSFSIHSLDGKYLGGENESGYCASGDCWGSNRWGGNCIPMCTGGGVPIYGVGKSLYIGEQRTQLQGHGNLALSADGTIYTGIRGAFRAIGMDGVTRWERNIIGAHPVVDGRGYVYVMAHNGTLHVFDSDGSQLWQWAMPGSDAQYFSMMGYHGLSVGPKNTLYASYSGSLFAIG